MKKYSDDLLRSIIRLNITSSYRGVRKVIPGGTAGTGRLADGGGRRGGTLSGGWWSRATGARMCARAWTCGRAERARSEVLPRSRRARVCRAPRPYPDRGRTRTRTRTREWLK